MWIFFGRYGKVKKTKVFIRDSRSDEMVFSMDIDLSYFRGIYFIFPFMWLNNTQFITHKYTGLVVHVDIENGVITEFPEIEETSQCCLYYSCFLKDKKDDVVYFCLNGKRKAYKLYIQDKSVYADSTFVLSDNFTKAYSSEVEFFRYSSYEYFYNGEKIDFKVDSSAFVQTFVNYYHEQSFERGSFRVGSNAVVSGKKIAIAIENTALNEWGIAIFDGENKSLAKLKVGNHFGLIGWYEQERN